MNVLDIAPRYSGTVVGIANCFGSATGIVVPVYVNWLIGVSPNRVYPFAQEAQLKICIAI